MSKPMYNSVEDARKGIVSGGKNTKGLTTKSQKLEVLSSEDFEQNYNFAKKKLEKILENIQKINP